MIQMNGMQENARKTTCAFPRRNFDAGHEASVRVPIALLEGQEG